MVRVFCQTFVHCSSYVYFPLYSMATIIGFFVAYKLVSFLIGIAVALFLLSIVARWLRRQP